MKIRGVYTIEAVFVVSICIWVLIAVCYGGMYVHDRVVLETVTNEELAARLSGPDRKEEKKWCGELKDKLQKKLFLFRILGVKEKSGMQSKKTEVRYSIPVSWNFLKKIFMGGKTELCFETVREDITPANYMWDSEIIKQ